MSAYQDALARKNRNMREMLELACKGRIENRAEIDRLEAEIRQAEAVIASLEHRVPA